MKILAQWQPQALSVLRIMSALLFMQHGTQKLFGFPASADAAHAASPPVLSLIWFAGVIETFGGALIAVGFYTRCVAFVASGEMAVAYFTAHAPNSFFPIINQGDLAVLFCFVFLYLATAGAGPWSLDAILRKRT